MEYMRAYDKAKEDSGESRERNGQRREYNRKKKAIGDARKKAYLAEVYGESPAKRHIVTEASRVVVLSDIQIPFEDPGALSQALDVVYRIKPDTVVLNGDVIDCYRESRFLHDPRKALDVIEETHSRVRMLLAALEGIPYKYWLGGNHEDRWRKLLWQPSLTPVALQLLKEHERVIREKYERDAFPMTEPDESFRILYDLDKHGFAYYPYGHRLYFADNNLIVTHGKYASKHSAYSAKRTWEWLGRSCIVGHSHRQGSYLITQDGREHGAWENGCLCQLEPEYDDTPNWQQGLSVVRIDGPEFNVLQVPIVRRNGVPVAAYYG